MFHPTESFEFLKHSDIPQTWAFFGASVTQQHHGYVDVFRKHCHEGSRNIHILQRGFGAMHIREAVLLLQTAIIHQKKDTPNLSVCFLEWLTSCTEFSPSEIHEFLTVIFEQLFLAKIIPVLLFLYNHSERAKRDNLKLCYQQKGLEWKILCIDLEPLGEKNFNKTYFRDDTHLTEAGSEIIGKSLYFTLKMPPRPWILKTLNTPWHKVKFYGLPLPILQEKREKKTASIHNITLPVIGISIKESFTLPYDLESKTLLVGLWLLVGPDSGWIEIQDEQTEIREKITIWDPWCHYERFMIRRFANRFILQNKLTLRLLEEDPAYSTCRRVMPIVPLDRRRIWLLGYSGIPATSL